MSVYTAVTILVSVTCMFIFVLAWYVRNGTRGRDSGIVGYIQCLFALLVGGPFVNVYWFMFYAMMYSGLSYLLFWK